MDPFIDNHLLWDSTHEGNQERTSAWMSDTAVWQDFARVFARRGIRTDSHDSGLCGVLERRALCHPDGMEAKVFVALGLHQGVGSSAVGREET